MKLLIGTLITAIALMILPMSGCVDNYSVDIEQRTHILSFDSCQVNTEVWVKRSNLFGPIKLWHEFALYHGCSCDEIEEVKTEDYKKATKIKRDSEIKLHNFLKKHGNIGIQFGDDR